MMNTKFEFQKTEIDGLYYIHTFNVDDLRGSFTKDYSQEEFQKHGISHDLKEVFYTTSVQGVVRALHFQREHQQQKLVRCVTGHIYDVVVDLRKGSETYSKWLGFNLTGTNHDELLIPGGCAHGYLVVEDSIVSYKCAEKFYGEYDDGIIWNDQDLAVEWPLETVGGIGNVILSDKDKNLQSFREFVAKYEGLSF